MCRRPARWGRPRRRAYDWRAHRRRCCCSRHTRRWPRRPPGPGPPRRRRACPQDHGPHLCGRFLPTTPDRGRRLSGFQPFAGRWPASWGRSGPHPPTTGTRVHHHASDVGHQREDDHDDWSRWRPTTRRRGPAVGVTYSCDHPSSSRNCPAPPPAGDGRDALPPLPSRPKRPRACRKPHPPWRRRWGDARGLGHPKRALSHGWRSPRHDGRSCCCDGPTCP